MRMTEDRARRWLNEAEGYLELEMFGPALERLDVLDQAPFFPFEKTVLRAHVLREQTRYAEGVPLYQRALTLRPGDLEATIGMGWCLKRVGKVDQAAETYVRSLKMHPDEAILHYNLACYLSLLQRPSESLESLTRALRLDGDLRYLAHHEEDFAPIRELPAFKELIALPKINVDQDD